MPKFIGSDLEIKKEFNFVDKLLKSKKTIKLNANHNGKKIKYKYQEEVKELENSYIKIEGQLFCIANYSCRESNTKGAFGNVVQAIDKEGRLYAIKISYDRGGINKNEIDIAKKMELCAIIGNDMSSTFMAMPFLGVDLINYVKSKKYRLSEIDLVKLVLGCVNALLKIHKKNIIHNDVKPDNIVVLNGEYTLIDFGFSCENLQGFYNSIKLSKRGTIDYIAPEAFEDQLYSVNSDIYSLGKSFELIYKYYKYPLPSILKDMINKDPKKRPPLELVKMILIYENKKFTYSFRIDLNQNNCSVTSQNSVFLLFNKYKKNKFQLIEKYKISESNFKHFSLFKNELFNVKILENKKNNCFYIKNIIMENWDVCNTKKNQEYSQ